LNVDLFRQTPRALGRTVSVALALVLLTMTGFSIWVAWTTHQLSVQVQTSTLLNNGYELARYAVDAEESLEGQYLLGPSPDIRASHQAAATELVDALQDVRRQSDASNQALVDAVLALHSRYVQAINRVFIAADRGDFVLSKSIDDTETDPILQQVKDKVVLAANNHQQQVLERVADLGRLQNTIFIATPVVFTAGLLLLGLFWWVLTVYQRRIDEQRTLQLSELRFRALVQNAADLILVVDAAGTVQYGSPSLEEMLGVRSEGTVGSDLLQFLHPEDISKIRSFFAEALKRPGHLATGEFRVKDKAGAWHYLEAIANNLTDNQAVRGMLLTCRDVSQRRALEDEMTHQAFHDPLTGLPNRALFMDRLQHALARTTRRPESIGVLFLDLDNFKLVNDTLGHQLGDALLMSVAGRLQRHARDGDTVARLGGDEFTILLEDLTEVQDAIVIAERVAEQLRVPFQLEVLPGQEIHSTISIGIAISTSGQNSPHDLLRDADVAMYDAKSTGKARYSVFEVAMNSRMKDRLELETELRRAVEEKQFRVFYQPIVELASGKILEVEALIRWDHPTRGLVPPGEFIPVAEQTGLILPIGQWVLEQAARRVRAWHDQFPTREPLLLSVNLSANQFRDPHLVEKIATTLKETGLAPGYLKLEITESVTLDHTESALATLHELRALGIHLAIDDFGTGYSSLSYLRRFPIDTLKIDRSFIEGLGRDSEGTAIVNAVIAVARTLKMRVTAEGIETAGQARMLRELGCDWGQGYYFAKPMPSMDLARLLVTRPLSESEVDKISSKELLAAPR
jgi:diguanylate cyclase (GGDEF)-like protein/PAS domain S-box-containing protein